MRKKKILVFCLALVLAALPMLNGTLAYFTDTDSAVNVMTMGSVEIVQHEQQRSFENGVFVGLEAFKKDKMLVPSEVPDQYLCYTGSLDDSYKFFADKNGESLPNPIDKIVTVENKGSIPAYVRTVFAFEAPEGFNRNAHTAGKPGWALMRNDIDSAVKGTKSNTEWKWTFFADDVRFIMGEDGQSYVIAVATAQESLGAGETTIPSLLQYYLNKFTDSQHVKAFGDELKIYAFTQAVQADGFDSAEEAFKESFGLITYDSVTGKFSNLPWNEGLAIPNGCVTQLSEDQIASVFGETYESFSTREFIDFAMTFVAPQDGALDEYENWNIDFVLSFDKNLENKKQMTKIGGSEDLNDGFVLIGSYPAYYEGKPMLFAVTDDMIYAGEEIRVLRQFGEVWFGVEDISAPYWIARDMIKTFNCGIVMDPVGKATQEPRQDIDGVNVTLELRFYETVNDGAGNYVETGKTYTAKEFTFTYPIA